MNTFVMEPISKTVSPLSGRLVVFRETAVCDNPAALRVDHADHQGNAKIFRPDAIGENLVDFIVGRHRRIYCSLCERRYR